MVIASAVIRPHRNLYVSLESDHAAQPVGLREQDQPPSWAAAAGKLIGWGPKDDARTDMKKKHETIAAKYRTTVIKPA